MGASVCKVSRMNGFILDRGYVFPDTQMSESSAEAVWMNSVNADPAVGYVVLDSEKEYGPEEILDIVYSYALRDTYLFNKVTR